MTGRIAIRREDKNRWERRAPFIPEHVKELTTKQGLELVVQPSELRVFKDEEYRRHGAIIQEDLTDCPIIFGIKEIPKHLLQADKTYIFFSHTIKGQSYNMPMLHRLLDLGCTLIDYEPVVDQSGRRLIFFGRFAGIAGMIDTLWTLGARLAGEGIVTPFQRIKQAYQYPSLRVAKEEISQVGAEIRRHGLPAKLPPLICGFTGYGNVSKGAQEIYELLGVEKIAPDDLRSAYETAGNGKTLYQVEFKEEDTVEPRASGTAFVLQDYFANPQHYRSKFEQYVPYLTMLINGIYWTARHPRLLTKDFLAALFSKQPHPPLKVIGDISCDIDGSIEATVKATEPDNPVFVYNPLTRTATDGLTGEGVAIMAVDNLPCELPAEASEFFSAALLPFAPAIAHADYTTEFEQCALPAAVKNAVIAYRGKLTPQYSYIATLW